MGLHNRYYITAHIAYNYNLNHLETVYCVAYDKAVGCVMVLDSLCANLYLNIIRVCSHKLDHIFKCISSPFSTALQLVPCSKCRYQYELMSGDVVDCESESIR